MIIGKNNQDINACCFLFARITSLNNWKVETIYACQKCNSILMDDKCGKMQSTFSKSINSHYMFFRSKCHFYHLYLTCRATLQPFMFNCSIIHYAVLCCILPIIDIIPFSIFQPLKSGTTAVCTLVRGNTLYSAWLGDSQSVLVRNGYPVKVVEPHKPNRPVRYKNS